MFESNKSKKRAWFYCQFKLMAIFVNDKKVAGNVRIENNIDTCEFCLP